MTMLFQIQPETNLRARAESLEMVPARFSLNGNNHHELVKRYCYFFGWLAFPRDVTFRWWNPLIGFYRCLRLSNIGEVETSHEHGGGHGEGHHDRSPNDQRSDVKNPNNPEYEKDQENREHQREENESKEE